MILRPKLHREAPANKIRLVWQKSTQRLIEPGALYGRMARVGPTIILCAYEKAGASWTRTSWDTGRFWLPPVLAARCDYGSAANPEILALPSGSVLLFFNIRPNDRKHRFAISSAISHSRGGTWAVRETPICEADSDPRNGCWEPAAIRLPSGEIQLFFANESPYRSSDEQEISVCRSFDEGKSWSAPTPACFRAGHRDGMPVPLVLRKSQTIAVAIEDNGLSPGALLQPAIFRNGTQWSWMEPVLASSPNRESAIQPPLSSRIYAGAPYLRQLLTGETILSCHSTEDRRGGKPRMVVYVGDPEARNFQDRTIPFDIPEDVSGMWNSLFVRNAKQITALSSTTIGGVFGLWAIDADIVRT